VTVLAAPPALARRKAVKPAAAPKEASAETARAIGELASRYKWGMTSGEVIKLVSDEVNAKFMERVQKEPNPFKQDVIRKKLAEELERVKENFIAFDGHKTGYDVSLIDREFAHKNDETMFVIKEETQRRFLFFFHDKLWKQFIAFNADHPAFAGKSFDDFAAIIQNRYGPASTTYRKARGSDDPTFDHLEWPPAGDFILWAIDLTTLYNNYCLSLMQRSVMPEVEKGRKERGVVASGAKTLIETVTKHDENVNRNDENSDVVDQITGRKTDPK
jgi:hypothetical protein